MSHFVHRAGPVRLAVLAGIALAAVALVWIGRASAEGAGAAAVSKTFSNISTARADAVDATSDLCTTSQTYVDMPGMSESFSFGGDAARPVIVLFEGQWGLFEGAGPLIRLTIDGVVQSGPGNIFVDQRPAGEVDEVETHGFNFVSDHLTPGMHTAKIQWRSANGLGICVSNRSLIVLHK